MSRQVDASADAGAATCHNEDIIKMFQANKQHVEEKEKKRFIIWRYANTSKIFCI